MAYSIKLFISTLVVFLTIDLAWLGIAAKAFYANQLGHLLSPSTNWIPAVVFYMLYILGILLFVVLPGIQQGSLRSTLLRGAFYGLITYATYDLTNLATLKDWPILLTLVDIAWGTVLCTLVSIFSYYIGKRLK